MSKSKLKSIEGNLKITSFFGATAKEPTTNSNTETSKDATMDFTNRVSLKKSRIVHHVLLNLFS